MTTTPSDSYQLINIKALQETCRAFFFNLVEYNGIEPLSF